jgi:2-polyprenyl-3-methyl-5-hydroxy-6-metoxy-1,4-benzoquinol methylase
MCNGTNYLDLPDYKSTISELDTRVRKLIPANSRILDVGCGAKTKLLADQGFNISGCDFDEKAMRRNQQIKEYRVCNAEELPFDADQFDAITSFDVIEHIENPQAFVESAFRILKPGGYFIAVMPHLNSLFGLIAANASLPVLRFFSNLLVGNATENHVHFYRMNTNRDCQNILLNAGFENTSVTYLNRLPSTRPLRYVLFPYYLYCKLKWGQKHSNSLFCIGRKPS